MLKSFSAKLIAVAVFIGLIVFGKKIFEWIKTWED